MTFMALADFNLGEGSKVSVVLRSGELFTGCITRLIEDKETGEINMTIE
ncbi:hypothetical protein JRC04_05135 [Mycolicibacterium sp. S2-37]|nr:hypothetical protein [Mycolicibacterium sp. S2-37]MBO0676841.1 hypothetical protein [Mycolicibacterium sp. S2-37]